MKKLPFSKKFFLNAQHFSGLFHKNALKVSVRIEGAIAVRSGKVVERKPAVKNYQTSRATIKIRSKVTLRVSIAFPN